MADNQDIVDRLNILEKALDVGGVIIANSIGLDQSQYSKIKRRKIGITLKQVMEISSKYSVRSGWLVEGEEPIFKKEKSGAEYTPDLNLLAQLRKEIEVLKSSLLRLSDLVPSVQEESLDQEVTYDHSSTGKTRSTGKL